MTPRRKKADEAPIDGVPADDKPKKKRAIRKKAAPPADESPLAAAPFLPSEPVKPASPGVSVPINTSEPPVPPTLKPDRVMPVGMKIEAVGPIPVDEDHADADLWRPPRKADADLSVPPKVLLEKKHNGNHEVVDILDVPGDNVIETDEDDGASSPQHQFSHPPVRTGLYRKIGVGFAVLAFLALLGVGYVVFSKATVVVHPRKVEVSTERVLTVSSEAADDSEEEIPGEVHEVTVAGERSASPSASATDTPGTPAEAVVDAIATGNVTLHNETATEMTLIPTTRLLTPEGILFRMKSRVIVPANGTAKAEVYADKAGASGNIGPSTFTIPGLSADLQKSVYAKSESSMTGGTKTASGTPVATPDAAVATQEDIDALEKELKDELIAQAKTQLAGEVSGTWTGEEYLVENMTRFVNVAAGQAADKIIVRLTLRVRYIGFDKVRAVTLAAKDLERGLTSDRVLQGIQGDSAVVTVESADPKDGTASVRIAVQGETTISLESSLFDAERLKGLSLGGVQTYFDGIEGVDRVDVRFVPFFIKRMPPLPDHITFEIAEE